MINSGIDIQFSRAPLADKVISAITFFDQKGRQVTSSDSQDIEFLLNYEFQFHFYSLAQNTPFRCILYNESFNAESQDTFLLREMANTWCALAMIYNTATNQGMSITPRISYTQYFIPELYYISNNHIGYLYFKSYTDGVNEKTASDGEEYLIHYPFIFKKSLNNSDIGYYALCTPRSLDMVIQGRGLPSLYTREDGFSVYYVPLSKNVNSGNTPVIQGLPVFELNNGTQIPNIIPSKFNLDRW